MKHAIQLTTAADLSPFLTCGEMVALNVGPEGDLYAVIALNDLDYRHTSSAGAIFAKAKPHIPQTYRIVALRDGDVLLDTRIEGELFNIHDIQPLPNNELLLVCARSYYRGPNDIDRNGRVYTTDGQFVREVLLGDSIQAVQATSTGEIWTSFFDEGIFGNCGWNIPVGAAGLVAWDSHGNKLYEFEPSHGLDSICDCYALNVESDSNTWLYYYAEFPLVRLINRKIASHWTMPLGGSSAFAVASELALFSGGYKQRDEYYLFELCNGYVEELATFRTIDRNDREILADKVIGRSHILYILSTRQVYGCDIHAVAAAL